MYRKLEEKTSTNWFW